MKVSWIVAVSLLVAAAAGGNMDLASAANGPSAPLNVGERNYTTTASGLKYASTRIGTGAAAKAGQKVSVHYTGWLKNGGKKFDSSHDRNRPFEFVLGQGKVIKGWDEGVKGMKVGETRQLVIPPELAYGARGTGADIPPNAPLIFVVELLEAK